MQPSLPYYLFLCLCARTFFYFMDKVPQVGIFVCYSFLWNISLSQGLNQHLIVTCLICWATTPISNQQFILDETTLTIKKKRLIILMFWTS